MQDATLPDSPPASTGVSEVVRLTPKVAPIFSLVADSKALGDTHNQVFCGNLAKSVVAWEPPDPDLIPKVHLNSHTGWVRGLATSRQWLFRYGWAVLYSCLTTSQSQNLGCQETCHFAVISTQYVSIRHPFFSNVCVWWQCKNSVL